MLAGMGGAMDLVTGAKTVYIVSEHCSKHGASKLMKQCTFPLTGAEEADVIITERALFRRHQDKGFVLEEVAAVPVQEDASTSQSREPGDARPQEEVHAQGVEGLLRQGLQEVRHRADLHRGLRQEQGAG